MYFTQDAMLPENQAPLIITVAPYGPQWLPEDFREDIPVTWEEQVQKAVDCYKAGATVLHLHVRDPKTGHGSKTMSEFNDQIARLRDAVPGMIIQVGGSISFAPDSEDDKAAWLGYDTRHMLAELDPKPDQITIVIGTTLMNIFDLTSPDDIEGTSLANPLMQAAYANMVADSTPEFYLEHLKRLREHDIQPMFALAHVHSLEAVEHLVRTGAYMGPVNHTLTAIGGAGGAGRNPFDFMEWVRRSPQGSGATIESWMRTVPPFCAMAIALGIHVRVGIEDNIWSRKGERMTSVQQVEQMVRLAEELHRPVATAEQARQILKIGTWYDSVEETLSALGLPPNRQGSQLGFMVKETDGRLHEPVVAGAQGASLG
jgi:uncharacterized protein (DUF849 family)